jgi:ADP-heptose:LPS heptosyltransferase
MEPNTMRRIDYWIGIPICFLLTVLYKIQRMIGLKDPCYSENPKNVLFVELAEMGSTVLALPAMKRMKQIFPNARIHFLLFKHISASMDILNAIPRNNVFTINSSNVFTLAVDTLKFMFVSRKRKIDTVINLEMFARFSTILGYLSGGKKRVAFYRYSQEGLYIGNFLTHKVVYNPHIHTAQSFVSLVEALGAPKGQLPLVKVPINNVDLKIPKLISDKKSKEKVWDILKKINPEINPGKKLILVNPNASKLISIRKWPLSSYARLVKKLLQDKDVFVAITGVASEKKDAEFISNFVKDKRVLDLTGKTTLRELIDLFNIGQLLITNDSGPAHFASLTNIHILVFFGPETPKLYKPLTDKCTVMYSNYACSPCVSAYNQRLSPCNDNKCLKTIEVEKVYGVVKGVLGK